MLIFEGNSVTFFECLYGKSYEFHLRVHRDESNIIEIFFIEKNKWVAV